jgi:hydrogenase nickel incorporation protein HypA/HybF
MHEFSVCLALLDEVDRVARTADATAVRSIVLRIGPLSGVEPDLLTRAFDVARRGTVAETAVLVVDVIRVRVRCTECGSESETAPNRLLCSRCGGYRTRVIAGDELVLSAVEMDVPDGGGCATAASPRAGAAKPGPNRRMGDARHV